LLVPIPLHLLSSPRYVLHSEIESGRTSPHPTRLVPWCSELHATPRRFADGDGLFCEDAFSVDGFEPHCVSGTRCGLRYVSAEGPPLLPLLGWHGSGHNGKRAFGPLWSRVRRNVWPVRNSGSVLSTSVPQRGVCGVTTLGEGDCERGWWGAWQGSTFADSVGQSLESCAALCRQCPRCAFYSWSGTADECNWFAQCMLPLQTTDGGEAFQTLAAPWAASELPEAPRQAEGARQHEGQRQHVQPSHAHSNREREMHSPRASHFERELRGACHPSACAEVETAAGCRFARARAGSSRACSPGLLWRAARTPAQLSHWLSMCSPGCKTTRRPAAAVAPATAERGARCHHHESRRARPLAGGRVYLWSMVSTTQPLLLDHFLRHYARLGIALDTHATFVVQTPPLTQSSTQLTLAVLAARGVARERISIVPNYTTALKRQLVNRFVRTLPAHGWLVYADVDEFFEYPCDVLEQLTSGREKASCANMIDRLGAGAALVTLRPEPAIEQQFSLCSEVRGSVVSGKSCLTKVTLIATRIDGAAPQWVTSHRAEIESADGSSFSIGGCSSSTEDRRCVQLGGFAHYQFYEQAHAFQISKIATHLQADDRANAAVYEEYTTLFNDEGRTRHGEVATFNMISLDSIHRHAVSCASLLCQPCRNTSSSTIAAAPAALAAPPSPLPPPTPVAAILSSPPPPAAAIAPSPPPPPPPPAAAFPSLLHRRSRSRVDRTAERTGTCEQTDYGGDCTSGTLGAWELTHGTLTDCVRLCEQCARCAFVSYARVNADCSWFSMCDEVTLLESVQGASGHSCNATGIRALLRLPSGALNGLCVCACRRPHRAGARFEQPAAAARERMPAGNPPPSEPLSSRRCGERRSGT
jgi:hypothetical protein